MIGTIYIIHILYKFMFTKTTALFYLSLRVADKGATGVEIQRIQHHSHRSNHGHHDIFVEDDVNYLGIGFVSVHEFHHVEHDET